MDTQADLIKICPVFLAGYNYSKTTSVCQLLKLYKMYNTGRIDESPGIIPDCKSANISFSRKWLELGRILGGPGT